MIHFTTNMYGPIIYTESLRYMCEIRYNMHETIRLLNNKVVKSFPKTPKSNKLEKVFEKYKPKLDELIKADFNSPEYKSLWWELHDAILKEDK